MQKKDRSVKKNWGNNREAFFSLLFLSTYSEEGLQIQTEILVMLSFWVYRESLKSEQVFRKTGSLKNKSDFGSKDCKSSEFGPNDSKSAENGLNSLVQFEFCPNDRK